MGVRGCFVVVLVAGVLGCSVDRQALERPRPEAETVPFVDTHVHQNRDARLGPGSASGMVEHTELFGIDLRHDGGIELGYSFDREVGWDDAMFNVAIEGWTPRPVSLDD